MTDSRPAARPDRAAASPQVALVTCAALPHLDQDDQALLPPLAARDISVTPVVWDAPAVDWSVFDLAVLRSSWDYPPRRAEFVAWAGTVPRLANPAGVVGWNTDKRYLAELAAAGVPVVATTWVALGATWTPPAAGEWVVKPAVGAGSKDTGRYRLGEATDRRLAREHVARLQRHGRVVMVQPYLAAVDTYGETALTFLAAPAGGGPAGGGLAFSHAVRKGPMLTGPDRTGAELYLSEQITARVPSAAELATAGQVLAALPAGLQDLLYARVDLIPGPDGAPVLVELELTEPSLFLGHAPGSADRFADAIAARVAGDPPRFDS